MPKVGSNYTFIGVILINFVFKKMKPIIYKFFWNNVSTLKKKKMIRCVTDEVEISFYDSDKDGSYKEEYKILISFLRSTLYIVFFWITVDIFFLKE